MDILYIETYSSIKKDILFTEFQAKSMFTAQFYDLWRLIYKPKDSTLFLI